jgi:hypothetical protein
MLRVQLGYLTLKLTMADTQGDTQAAQLLNLLHEFNNSFRQDRRRTIHDIAEEVGIRYGTCQRVLTEELAPNFGENRPGCFTMTTPRHTIPSSPSSFWRKTKELSSPTHRTPLIWHPLTSPYFKK